MPKRPGRRSASPPASGRRVTVAPGARLRGGTAAARMVAPCSVVVSVLQRGNWALLLSVAPRPRPPGRKFAGRSANFDRVRGAMSKQPLLVVVLAAGKGVRMASTRPKVL